MRTLAGLGLGPRQRHLICCGAPLSWFLVRIPVDLCFIWFVYCIIGLWFQRDQCIVQIDIFKKYHCDTWFLSRPPMKVQIVILIIEVFIIEVLNLRQGNIPSIVMIWMLALWAGLHTASISLCFMTKHCKKNRRKRYSFIYNFVWQKRQKS